MEKPVEPVVSVKPSNAATKVEEASVRVNSRFVIPPKPTSRINTSKPVPPKPKSIIMPPRTNISKKFNVGSLFTTGQFPPKLGGKRTKKRSKKAKKTRKH